MESACLDSLCTVQCRAVREMATTCVLETWLNVISFQNKSMFLNCNLKVTVNACRSHLCCSRLCVLWFGSSSLCRSGSWHSGFSLSGLWHSSLCRSGLCRCIVDCSNLCRCSLRHFSMCRLSLMCAILAGAFWLVVFQIVSTCFCRSRLSRSSWCYSGLRSCL